MGRLCVIGVAITLLPSAALADEAVRRDGSRLSGKLILTDREQFAFESHQPSDIAAFEIIRFISKAPATPAVPVWHQIQLVNGDSLIAELRKLDGNHLHVRTTWADSLAIPRTAVDRVTNMPGSRPVFVDTFDRDLAAWTKAGEPIVADGKLTFNASNQSVEAKLKQPLSAGRVSVGFVSSRTKTRRVELVLDLVQGGRVGPVRVELVGPSEHMAVHSSFKPMYEGKIRRDSSVRHATVELTRDGLNIFVDELVLWSQSSAGVLRSIKLVADGEGTESVTIDDVVITQSVNERIQRSWADLTADAVRSPEGDETFGEISAAGPVGVTLEVKGRQQALGWSDVDEFTFRRGAVESRPTKGEHVQARLRSVDNQRDRLTGAVKSFDAKTLVLMHPVLGDLIIPRERLEEVRLLFHGRSVPIDSTPRHLGSRPAFGFAVPRPDGLRFAKTIRLGVRATSGFVVISAAHVTGKGTPVEVIVNGEVTGMLNRLADRSNFVVRDYRLKLPKIEGDDVEVRIGLKPPASGGRVDGIDLRGVRLELHDPR